MALSLGESIPIRSAEDVVRMRQAVRSKAVELGLNLIDQTKLVTAASELARNILDHGGGEGHVHLEPVTKGGKTGLQIIFEDKGPGIADLDLAMKDGYTSGGGLGLGLGGAKRLVNEFEITTRPGEGTRIVITRWK